MKVLSGCRLVLLALLLLAVSGPSAWALTAEITDITLGETLDPPQPLKVLLRVDTDQPDLPPSAFSVREQGQLMDLDPACDSVVTRPVDIAFIIDRSRSMEDNIDSVASRIITWIEALPSNLDFRFGLVLYGQSDPPAYGCGDYPGAPRNETTDSLRHAESLVARLHQIANTYLQGGQEPAYHAIRCALQTTAWRPNSERFVVLVSDENNDTCQWHGAIPLISEAQMINELNAANAKFYGWINNEIACDCYDDCVAPYPPCSQLVPYGCVSGYDDFRPLADGTGGDTRSLDEPFQGLLDVVAIALQSIYYVCYWSDCCYPDVPITVQLDVDYNGEHATDTEVFTRTECPEAVNPVAVCWSGNPAFYVYGQPATLCAVVTDLDNNLESVMATYTIGSCTATVPAVQTSGRWCVTVPPNCTQSCENLSVVFLATDLCGATDTASCVIPGTVGTPDEIMCWRDNPPTFWPGADTVVCVEAVQPGLHNIVTVTARYNAGIPGCVNVAAPVTPVGPDRWCMTLPASCLTPAVPTVFVTFIATNECGARDTVTCRLDLDTRFGCYDLGQLPPPYPTADSTGGGPAHRPGGVWLGTDVDCENEPWDDFGQDNGIVINCVAQGNWDNCAEIVLPVTVSIEPGFEPGPLYLSGWLDENGDGDFLDQFSCDQGQTFHSEWFIQDVVVVPGVNNINVVVSHSSLNDSIHVRLRLDLFPFGPLGFSDVGALVPPGRLPGWPRANGEVEDYSFYCQSAVQCCELCVITPPVGLEGRAMAEYQGPLNLVVNVREGSLWLNWNAVPGASHYKVLRGSFGANFADLQLVGWGLAGLTEWREPLPIGSLPRQQIYVVQPMEIAPRPVTTLVDRGRWEMNENAGPWAMDFSGNNFHALRWPLCPPTWGSEFDETCEDNIGFMHFEGFEGHPDCGEHLRVDNDDIWYGDDFQLWTCLRIFEEPTIDTGPYYIISNNSFATMHGGFALRIDPAWFYVNGVREYHNRLTAMVWNESLQNWMTIQSPLPDPAFPGLYSVPIGQWAQICWIVDGANSMLIINDVVVAIGNQEFESNNNGAPLIIGAGYRHHTYPIEYPFRGDIDCIRITDLELP